MRTPLVWKCHVQVCLPSKFFPGIQTPKYSSPSADTSHPLAVTHSKYNEIDHVAVDTSPDYWRRRVASQTAALPTRECRDNSPLTPQPNPDPDWARRWLSGQYPSASPQHSRRSAGVAGQPSTGSTLQRPVINSGFLRRWSRCSAKWIHLRDAVPNGVVSSPEELPSTTRQRFDQGVVFLKKHIVQSFIQSITNDWSIDKSITQTINQSMDQTTDQWINHPINQSTEWLPVVTMFESRSRLSYSSSRRFFVEINFRKASTTATATNWCNDASTNNSPLSMKPQFKFDKISRAKSPSKDWMVCAPTSRSHTVSMSIRLICHNFSGISWKRNTAIEPTWSRFFHMKRATSDMRLGYSAQTEQMRSRPSLAYVERRGPRKEIRRSSIATLSTKSSAVCCFPLCLRISETKKTTELCLSECCIDGSIDWRPYDELKMNFF